jgi:hypothetical protein
MIASFRTGRLPSQRSCTRSPCATVSATISPIRTAVSATDRVTTKRRERWPASSKGLHPAIPRIEAMSTWVGTLEQRRTSAMAVIRGVSPSTLIDVLDHVKTTG